MKVLANRTLATWIQNSFLGSSLPLSNSTFVQFDRNFSHPRIRADYSANIIQIIKESSEADLVVILHLAPLRDYQNLEGWTEVSQIPNVCFTRLPVTPESLRGMVDEKLRLLGRSTS